MSGRHLVLAMLLSVATACGGGGETARQSPGAVATETAPTNVSPTSSPTGSPAGSAEDQAAAAVLAYLGALADGDYSGACARLSPKAQRDAAEAARAAGVTAGDCPTQIEQGFSAYDQPEEIASLRNVKVASVEIRGSTGAVHLEGGGAVPVVKIGGAWLIARLSGG